MIENISTHELLTQLKQGHDEVLNILYPHYARMFYAYSKHDSLSHEDAEDIVQMTFWNVLDHIDSYDEAHGGGERWLWSICKHLVIDALRRKQRTFPEAVFLLEDSDPEGYIENQERLHALSCAWDALEETDRHELQRGRGRGPGRKAWHTAVQRLRTIYLRSQQ